MSSVIAPAAEAHSPSVAARKNFAADLILEIDIRERLPVCDREPRSTRLDLRRTTAAGSGGRSLLLPHGTTNDQDQEAGCGKNNQE